MTAPKAAPNGPEPSPEGLRLAEEVVGRLTAQEDADLIPFARRHTPRVETLREEIDYAADRLADALDAEKAYAIAIWADTRERLEARLADVLRGAA